MSLPAENMVTTPSLTRWPPPTTTTHCPLPQPSPRPPTPPTHIQALVYRWEKVKKPIWPNLLLQHWTGEHVSGHPGLTPVHPVSSYYSHPAFLPHARDIREAQAGMQVGYQVGTKWLRRVTAVLVQIAEKDSFSLFPLIGWFSAINRPLFTTWCQSLERGQEVEGAQLPQAVLKLNPLSEDETLSRQTPES